MALPSSTASYAPSTVPATRKYRDAAASGTVTGPNIMFDSRVRRGSTLASTKGAQASGGPGTQTQGDSRRRKRVSANPFKATAKPLYRACLCLRERVGQLASSFRTRPQLDRLQTPAPCVAARR